jgi:hypothetical protein
MDSQERRGRNRIGNRPGRTGGAVNVPVENNQRVNRETADNFAHKKECEQDPWAWAAARLTTWGKMQKDDYDFRSWMKGATEDLLNAGCLYEYARESHKFRCVLALDRRKRGQFGGILTEFERSSTGYVHLSRSGWETWLHDFADELVANKSFAEVLRADETNVHKSLKKLRDYNLFRKLSSYLAHISTFLECKK